MNNNRPRIAASQVGASGTLMRSGNNNGNNSTISNASGGKEGIVQKLQGVLFAVRRDRDREHRSRDIAMEKLRSAKEVFEAETLNFGEQKKKLTKTREAAEKTQKEILRKEATIQELQQKVRKAKKLIRGRDFRYDAFLVCFSFSDLPSRLRPYGCFSQYRFQHEDLIRKREKIQQQNSALEATSLQRNKSVLDARRRLDRQRNKYQKLERMEDQESENLLTRIMSLDREQNKPASPHDANANTVASTQAKDGTEDEALSQNSTSDLDKFLEAFEKKQEEALMKEFKTNIDYTMLPKMISQKAQALKAESKAMHDEITRLESMLHGTANANYRHE
jgi:hypothetical protein